MERGRTLLPQVVASHEGGYRPVGATVCGMWATLETWLLGDGEVPELRIDEVLAHKGLRLSCDAFGPSAKTTTGAWTTGAGPLGAGQFDVAHSWYVGPASADWSFQHHADRRPRALGRRSGARGRPDLAGR